MNEGLDGNVDETLARYSDLLYGSAVAIYVLAMLMFLAALAGVRGRKAAEKSELVATGAGGAVTVEAGDRTPGRVGGPAAASAKRPLGERLGAMAYPVLIVGIIAHVASVVIRAWATERGPWGNMFEFISFTCAAGIIVGVVMLRKPAQRPLLSFVLLPVTLLMFIAGQWLYTDAAPVVPALKSYWLIIHVSVVSISSGILLVSGVASILYLVKQRWADFGDIDAEGTGIRAAARRIVDRLPTAAVLDRVAYKTVIVGFPLFGLGVIFGAIWAEAAWGRFWGWDPKETVSFIAWVIYAAYLHARATAGWRNNAATWINIAGFVATLFNLFVINLVVSGLHSYAGL